MALTVISDVHGKIARYAKILCEFEKLNIPTIQIGDMGWQAHYKVINDGDIHHENNYWIHGNHDQPPYDCKNFLGRFGHKTIGGISFFFVSGGFSIDHKRRTPGLDWFYEEELGEQEWDGAVELYKVVKPNYVITHEGPRCLANVVGNPNLLRDFGYNPETFRTRTSEYLQRCFLLHQPLQWICGHYHTSRKVKIEETQFTVLNELETYTIF
jgi:hypothetical protein